MLWLFRFSDAVFLLLVAANTFININTIISFFSKVDLDYINIPEATEENYMNVILLVKQEGETNFINTTDGFGCDSNTPTMSVQCPYVSSAYFIAFMSVAGAYYLVLYLTRFFAAHKYPATDFRYHFYIDQYNTSMISRILFAVGMILTLVIFVIGHVFETQDNDGVPPSPGDVWPLWLFVATSASGLWFTSDYAEHQNQEMWEDELLKQPVEILDLPGGLSIGNVLGLAFDRKTFFSEMQLALGEEHTVGGVFDKLTNNPKALMYMMKKLSTEEPEAVTPAVAERTQQNAAPDTITPTNK